jgi:hypothetical protein
VRWITLRRWRSSFRHVGTVIYIILYKIPMIFFMLLRYYLSIKFRLWIFKYRSSKALSKALKQANIPKELRVRLVTQYKKELAKLLQQLSIHKLLKTL